MGRKSRHRSKVEILVNNLIVASISQAWAVQALTNLSNDRRRFQKRKTTYVTEAIQVISTWFGPRDLQK